MINSLLKPLLLLTDHRHIQRDLPLNIGIRRSDCDVSTSQAGGFAIRARMCVDIQRPLEYEITKEDRDALHARKRTTARGAGFREDVTPILNSVPKSQLRDLGLANNSVEYHGEGSFGNRVGAAYKQCTTRLTVWRRRVDAVTSNRPCCCDRSPHQERQHGCHYSCR